MSTQDLSKVHLSGISYIMSLPLYGRLFHFYQYYKMLMTGATKLFLIMFRIDTMENSRGTDPLGPDS